MSIAGAFLSGFQLLSNKRSSLDEVFFASRDINKGETVLTERPIGSSEDEFCHPMILQILKADNLQKFPKTRAFVGVVADLMIRARASEAWPVAPNEMPPMDILQAHESEVLDRDIQFLTDKGLVSALSTHFDMTSFPDVWNESKFANLFQKIKTNYYSTPTGSSLYIIASFMNHSCYRNCMWKLEDDGGNGDAMQSKDTVVAMADIKEGTQLFMSYSLDPEALGMYGITCRYDPDNAMNCMCSQYRTDTEYVKRYHVFFKSTIDLNKPSRPH